MAHVLLHAAIMACSCMKFRIGVRSCRVLMNLVLLVEDYLHDFFLQLRLHCLELFCGKLS